MIVDHVQGICSILLVSVIKSIFCYVSLYPKDWLNAARGSGLVESPVCGKRTVVCASDSRHAIFYGTICIFLWCCNPIHQRSHICVNMKGYIVRHKVPFLVCCICNRLVSDIGGNQMATPHNTNYQSMLFVLAEAGPSNPR